MVYKVNNYMDRCFDSRYSIYFILIFTAFIVLPNIIRESFWLDEIFSATSSLKSSSLYTMFSQFIFNDVHPPIYHVLLYFWGRAIGSSDLELRLFSYIAVLLSFVISYVLLSKYFTRRIAIIFLVFCAMSPGVLYYAQEVRSYALLYGVSNLLSIVFVILIDNIRRNGFVDNRLLLFYSFLGVFICYIHLFGYITIFSLSLIVLFYLIKYGDKKSTLNFIFYSFLSALVAIVWIVIIFKYGSISDKVHGSFWIKFNIIGSIKGLADILMSDAIGLVGYIIIFIGFVISWSKFINIVNRKLFIVFPPVLIFFVAFTISLHTPILTGRNLIVAVPTILLFITFLCNEMYDQKKIFMVIGMLFLVVATSVKNFSYEKQNWKGASQYIIDNFDSANCKVPIRSEIDPSTGHGFNMYVSYYLGDEFLYSNNGPTIQADCDLVFFDGHWHFNNRMKLKKIMEEKYKDIKYKIIDFNDVFVVIKNN